MVEEGGGGVREGGGWGGGRAWEKVDEGGWVGRKGVRV